MWKSFRILLSENCNAHCPNCFNRSSRSQAEININDLRDICNCLVDMGVEKLKIMGGEPTTHSEFELCYNETQKYFKKTVLFTNVINDKILNISPRETDIIDYNFNFISIKTNVKKFLLNKLGYRAFEIQVTNKTDVNFIIKKLDALKLLFNGRTIYIFLTLDCTSNIFLQKQILLEKWNYLVSYLSSDTIFEWHIDHIIPKCFYEGVDFLTNIPSQTCRVACAGLIDANLNMRYCNQYNNIICQFSQFKKMSMNDKIQCYTDFYHKKLSLSADCSECKNYLVDCNGGCFMHKYNNGQ